MNKILIKTNTKQILADTVTPVSIFLKIRDIFPKAILLESSDYHGNEDSHSFIAFNPLASFVVDDNTITEDYFGEKSISKVTKDISVAQKLESFYKMFAVDRRKEVPMNGIFGYVGYDAIPYFEDIQFHSTKNTSYHIPEIRYDFYQVIIVINHHKNTIQIIENCRESEASNINYYEQLILKSPFSTFPFLALEEERSNIDNDTFKEMVSKAKAHCYRGDVFQMVLSRQFQQKFQGDEFNVYRALRSVNPSPYLFYFDYGSYKIFGSSPEAQIQIKGNSASIHPIAGTFKRTGNDLRDQALAKELSEDKKENAEHVMLVDLARNDLSIHAHHVHVETFREVQYYSHVLHMVSKVTGTLNANQNLFDVFGNTFPAGTLSGAPKYKAMQLIDKYENQSRGFYGGSIGFLSFQGDFNHAIMIRSFLSKDQTLYYQAGAGIVAKSSEESELQEVNNKLAALKKAIEIAQTIES
ncbi:anthranilate synthase component I family protein [Halosquirtibacter xylanolyticus]|uniref:anthranilate synthase component I family protein n=1 Tax=Halosquirtibacter xylanolyticus TaxID=3374599 RepID=UPI0037494750|nr:anthranilate synthase component I family protein [Prolixibacteraceae bacterium]